MRQNLEPLKYSTLAPSRYIVYVHASEYARLEGIVGLVHQQTIRALNEELAALNHASRLRRYAERVLRRAPSVIQNAAPEWHVEFLADPDGDLKPGDVLVDSELLLPASPELGVGARTRRITTVHVGARVTTREAMVADRPVAPVVPPPAESAILALVAYADDGGPHSYEIVKSSVSIGRGGVAYPVDIRVASSADVSREHARIRRNPETGAFFLIDLSTLGTTLDGRAVPRGFDEADGSKRENGVEVPLPDRARIGLADTVFLDFQVVR